MGIKAAIRAGGVAVIVAMIGGVSAGDDRPNILWIFVEDTNDWMSCYGDELIETPHIDALAARGVQFNRAYMTAGVCSAARSAVVTGMYQTSIGAQHHQSSRPVNRGKVMEAWKPNHIALKTIPELFREAGYYVFNEGTVKDDYNFVFDLDLLYDHHQSGFDFKGATGGSDWSGCPEGQPFFGQVQLRGGKQRNVEQIVDRDSVPIPPYYADHPAIREEIAHHYDTILHLDDEVRQIVEKLKEDGLYENTIILFVTDHGMRLIRHKQFLYEGGIRVPMIMAGPGLPEGRVRDDLVSGIDLGPTSLALAEIEIPDHMQGKDIFAEDFHRDYVVAARDRCDFTIDRIRAVTTKRFKYIRNYMTDRPWMQPQYRDRHPYTVAMRELYEQGALNVTSQKPRG